MTMPETAARGLDRRTGIAGLVFVVLFVLGWTVGGGTPDYDAPDEEWVRWFADDDNTLPAVAGMFTLALSAVAFVPFLTGLLRRVRRAVTDAEGLPMIGLAAGIIFSTTTIIAAVAINQVAAALEFAGGGGDYPIPGADVLRQSEQLGFGVGLIGGGWAAALCVAAISWSARGTTSLPAWLSTAGLAVAVVLLFSVFFIPLALFALWALAVSIVLLRS